jgi:DUF4097 and DUF4098 domain-containing protein YvlB
MPLLRISTRYKKKTVNLKAREYALYLKVGTDRNFWLFGYFDTYEKAVNKYKDLKYGTSEIGFNREELSDDYRIRLVVQNYFEKEVSVPSIRQIETRLPELKGFLT